ncbi:MAG: class II fructose-bisphosphate aldolase [Chloroflexota bacterium]
MVIYSTVAELLDSVKGIVDMVAGELKISDEQKLKLEAIDRLVYNAVFGSDEVRSASRWLIWEAGQQLGVYPSSIQGLYEARGRGDVGNDFTVPAMNLRGLTYDVGRAAIRAAIRHNVGAFIFEIARSEIGYTEQRPAEYATVIIAAAIKEGFRGPLFIQGDHVQVNRKRWEKDAAAEIESTKRLISEEIEAGFYNIDIDSSTLVELGQSTELEQQRNNYTVAADLTEYIRSLEPKGITISVGGEIGEVGGKNSTPEELHAFMKGYLDNLQQRGNRLKGISKISVQTGTAHGGVVLPDGSIAQVALDFEVLRNLSQIARTQYGLGGAVQHGASTLPDEAFHKFVISECCEVHLATGFQNMMYESSHFPSDLRGEIYSFLKTEFADEMKPGQTEEQFIYKTRKKGYGPFKKRMWDLPQETRGAISSELEEKIAFYYQQLSVVDSKPMVDQWVKPEKVSKPKVTGL